MSADRVVVLEGALHFHVDGIDKDVSAGNAIDIPKGSFHWARNLGDTPAVATWESRPALRTAEFFVTMSRAMKGKAKPRLVDAMAILREYRDVFQLATTLYLALDGTHPFSRGEHGNDRWASILEDTPPPPRTTSPQLGQILQLALAKRPEDRFLDPATFAAILRQHVPPVAASVYDELASAMRAH